VGNGNFVAITTNFRGILVTSGHACETKRRKQHFSAGLHQNNLLRAGFALASLPKLFCVPVWHSSMENSCPSSSRSYAKGTLYLCNNTYIPKLLSATAALFFLFS
jgi:hypothetical protein